MVDKKTFLSNWIKEGVKITDQNIGIIKSLEVKYTETERALENLIKSNEEKFRAKGGVKKKESQKAKKPIPILARRCGKKM